MTAESHRITNSPSWYMMAAAGIVALACVCAAQLHMLELLRATVNTTFLMCLAMNRW